ncbi:hypothetical protein EII17_04585 [Clostridiales bacterium COT073_COT-073]|nr:hypothetical protein EII17_04585 [Clostridiales bacterium COT073_COT-073]
MNGLMIAAIVGLTALLAVSVDRWLYTEEKPHLIWRLMPGVIYVGAAAYLFLRFGFNAFWVRNLWMLTLFLVSTAEDIRKKEIPIEFYLVFLVPVVILHLAQADWINPLVALGLYGIFYLLARYSKQAIGYGDAVAIPTLCLLGGYQTGGVIVLMALILVGILGLILLVIKKANRKTEVPFIPFLTMAYLIYLWF